MKSILIYELFYQIFLDTIGPLLETIDGNKYEFVVVDPYSKWCEARPIKYDVLTATKFLKDEIIFRYGIPKYVMKDNWSEWMKQFAEMCHNYGITQ